MVILFLSLGYFILSAGLLLQRGVSGIVALAVSAIFVIFARKHLLAASLLLFFLMPIAGFLDNISSKAQAIPVLLGPLSGWGLGAALSPRPTGTTSNNNHRFLALISLGSAITV